MRESSERPYLSYRSMLLYKFLQLVVMISCYRANTRIMRRRIALATNEMQEIRLT